MNNFRSVACVSLLTFALLSGCNQTKTPDSSSSTNNLNSSATPEAIESPVEDQTELFKPAAGTGNVQGKVLYNDKPAVGIEVTLNEKFSSIFGPSGKSYKAKTDKTGYFVIKNVPPKEYEGLTARVFDTPAVVFMQSGILSAKKYTVEADKTLFVDATNLFKSDLKVISPKASALVAGNVAFKWQPYADAAYYKITLSPKDYKNSPDVYDVRVDGTTYTTAKPLAKDTYTLQIRAYNAKDHKLADNSEGYKFRVVR